jgi:hypothetical protein
LVTAVCFGVLAFWAFTGARRAHRPRFPR